MVHRSGSAYRFTIKYLNFPLYKGFFLENTAFGWKFKSQFKQQQQISSKGKLAKMHFIGVWPCSPNHAERERKNVILIATEHHF